MMRSASHHAHRARVQPRATRVANRVKQMETKPPHRRPVGGDQGEGREVRGRGGEINTHDKERIKGLLW